MRKVFYKVIALLLVVFSIMLSLPSADINSATAVKISKKKITIYVGSVKKLILKGADASGIKWTSSDKKVATVSSKGKVKGIKEGKATISAKYKGKKYTCNVTVKNQKTSYTSAKVNISIDEYYREFSGNEAAKVLSLIEKLENSNKKTCILSGEYAWTITVKTDMKRMEYVRACTSDGWVIVDGSSGKCFKDMPELNKAVIEILTSDEKNNDEGSFIGYSIKCKEPVTETEYLDTATKLLADWLEQMKGSQVDDKYRNTGYKIEEAEKSAYLACGMVNGRKEFVCELCFTALDCGNDTFYDKNYTSGNYTLAGRGWNGNYILARFAWENGKCTVLETGNRFGGYDIRNGLNGISRSGYKNFFEFARRTDMEEALEKYYAGYDWATNIVSKNLTQNSDGVPVNINIYSYDVTSEDENTITGIWSFSSGMNGKVVYGSGVYFTDNGTGHMEDTLPRNFKLVFDNYTGDANPDYAIRYMNDEDGTYYALENLINDGRVLNYSGRAFEGGIYVAGCFEPSVRLQKTEDIAYIGWKKENGKYYPTNTRGDRIELPDLNMYSDRYFLPGDMKKYSKDETSVTCFLWNNTENTIKTDAEYSIQIYEKGQWNTVGKGIKINGVSVPARGYAEISYDIQSLTVRKNALYRIVQKCGKNTAYGKFVCEGDRDADFSVNIENMKTGMYSTKLSIINDSGVEISDIKKAVIKTKNGDVPLTVIGISENSYRIISPDFPQKSGTYTIVLNDNISAKLKIEDMKQKYDIRVDAEKLEDGIKINIDSNADLELNNIAIFKKSPGGSGYEALGMLPDKNTPDEKITPSKPYSIKLIDRYKEYFSDYLIHTYYDNAMESWDEYYNLLYSDYGITKDMTEEEFGEVFKNIFLYSSEGEYIAYISFDLDDGDTITVVHNF